MNLPEDTLEHIEQEHADAAVKEYPDKEKACACELYYYNDHDPADHDHGGPRTVEVY